MSGTSQPVSSFEYYGALELTNSHLELTTGNGNSSFEIFRKKQAERTARTQGRSSYPTQPFLSVGEESEQHRHSNTQEDLKLALARITKMETDHNAVVNSLTIVNKELDEKNKQLSAVRIYRQSLVSPAQLVLPIRLGAQRHGERLCGTSRTRRGNGGVPESQDRFGH